MLESKTLSNELVKLIPMLKEDYEWLYAVASDPEIWEQHPDKMRYTPLGFTKYYQKLLDTNIPYLIIDKESEKIIGATSYYDFNENDQSIAIGYTFLAKAYWGGIYNGSIKKLMLDYAFEKLDKVIFHVRSNNLRSIAALEKIGAHKISEFDLQDGVGIQYTYAIIK